MENAALVIRQKPLGITKRFTYHKAMNMQRVYDAKTSLIKIPGFKSLYKNQFERHFSEWQVSS